jgi:hypothetical protein
MAMVELVDCCMLQVHEDVNLLMDYQMFLNECKLEWLTFDVTMRVYVT